MVAATAWATHSPVQIMADGIWYPIIQFDLVTLAIDIGAATNVVIEYRDGNDENVTVDLATYIADDIVNIEYRGQIRKVDTGGASIVTGVGITRRSD